MSVQVTRILCEMFSDCFQLTPEQAQQLNDLTAEQWLQHCQNVRANHPRTEAEIDAFLLLPIEKIVEVFHGAVQHLVASSSSPSDPPTPDPTASTSTSAPPLDPPTSKPPPTLSAPLPMVDIPTYPYTFTDSQLDKCAHFTDAQFYSAARNFKHGTKNKNRAFYKAHSI